jgi:hypothetical protein
MFFDRVINVLHVMRWPAVKAHHSHTSAHHPPQPAAETPSPAIRAANR